ncbi:MAG TPA: high-affinity branched-chain amino acid ABC transporter permease LivM [Alphaproteobacteria bacterium]|nr:high-affinity branched-chain amino acid ABC transporter permease LivM [Alphaproteobacteria bacterium]
MTAAAEDISGLRPRLQWRAAVREAGIAALIAAILGFPILGVRIMTLEGGLTLVPNFLWLAIGTGAVFLGRLAVALHGLRPATAGSAAQSPLIIATPRGIDRSGEGRRWFGLTLVAFAILLPVFPFTDRYLLDLATTVLIYMMLGWGLNIVVGLAGLLDLGYVAFYAIGAYSFALLARHFHLDFWACLPLAGGLAALCGVLLGFPVLRMRGDYLAIVTLGLGEIIHILLQNWTSLTGGSNGLLGIPRPTLFGWGFGAGEGGAGHSLYWLPPRMILLFYIILALALLTNAFTLRVRHLPLGRAWEALREDEGACRALGLNPTTLKLSAFGIGALFGGLAGCFFATRQGFISPESFTFVESATVLAIVVLGGMGSQIGVAGAATLLVLLPEFGREFEHYRMLVFGVAMVAIIIWRRGGLIAHRRPTIHLGKAQGSERSSRTFD